MSDSDHLGDEASSGLSEQDRGTAIFVKICGLSTSADVEAAVAAGADAVGFVLTDSPRQIAPSQVRELVRVVPDGIMTVGVFGPEPTRLIRHAAMAAGVTAIQLHGCQPHAAFAAVADLGLTLIRATSSQNAPGAEVGDYGEQLLILDSAQPGSGTRWFDSFPDALAVPRGRWLLAGGLSPVNVVDAVTTCRPWGVDVSSGVESSRGVKSPALITRFVHHVREIQATLERPTRN